MADASVYLRCVKEAGRLRVRIISYGYFQEANCQFPRAIREEGRVYKVPPSSIRLAASRGGTYFYRVSQPIEVCDDDGNAVASAPAPTAAPQAKKSRKRKHAAAVATEKPATVYDDKDEPECVVCLEAEKERIFVPCGHYCMCAACITQLVHPQKCPLCRTAIKTSILPSEL